LRKKQKLDKGAEQKKRKRKGQQAEKDENDEEERWAVGCGDGLKIVIVIRKF